MGRKKRNTNNEGVMDLLVQVASTIPWWATLPAALLLFIFIPGAPADIQLQEQHDFIGAILSILLKAFFKYLVPMALVFGAVINIFTAFKSFTLFKSIAKNGAHQTVKNISWQNFEFLLSEWFKKEGYGTELTGGGGADGGIDIKLRKNGELYLVQCKHYKAWKVSVGVVRELFGVMAAENAAGGFVVTSGKFTKEAYLFAKGKNIELIDGNQLESVLDAGKINVLNNNAADSGICPKCGSKLVRRSGSRGPFIGCSAYPKCRHTESL